MQQAIYQFFIHHSVTQEEKNQMLDSFKKLDKDKNGTLSKKEIKEGFLASKIVLSD